MHRVTDRTCVAWAEGTIHVDLLWRRWHDADDDNVLEDQPYRPVILRYSSTDIYINRCLDLLIVAVWILSNKTQMTTVPMPKWFCGTGIKISNNNRTSTVP